MNARVRPSRVPSFHHALAACALLLAASCANPAQPAPALEGTQLTTASPLALTAADADRAVALQPGQEFIITLQTIGAGEYGDPQLSSPSVRFLGLAPRGPQNVQNPGGARQVFQFRAVSAGEARIVLLHNVRPSSFSLTVDVK